VRSSPDDTQPGIRMRGGWACPKCGFRRGTPPRPHEVARCPDDGYALLDPEVIADGAGDPFLGATVADRYVVVGRLGAGSMGNVYRARQEAMGRDVALKILRADRAFDSQAKARFQREARAMSLLASPHTVTVFDFGEITDTRAANAGAPANAEPPPGAGSLYLAMEKLEGESLGQRLKVRRRLRVEDAVRVTRHALHSLAEAHDKGIIHRDLKPDNLFLCRTADGEICKVLDFGIAKVLSDTHQAVDALETQAGTVFGTPRYMSPEQAQARPLDARSDLYALGVLLYQMLVGRAPFVDDDAVVVMAHHIKSVPTSPVDAAPEARIPQPLSDLVMRALAKDPNDRPPSARVFLTELEAALDARAPSRTSAGPAGATGAMAAVVPHSAPSDLGRSKRVLVAAGTGLAVLAIGLAALTAIGPRRGAAPVRSEAAPAAPPAATSEATGPAPDSAPAGTASTSADTSADASAAPTTAASQSPQSSAAAHGVPPKVRGPLPPAPGTVRQPGKKKTYVIFE
jgi:serine/threonine-protein kinase